MPFKKQAFLACALVLTLSTPHDTKALFSFPAFLPQSIKKLKTMCTGSQSPDIASLIHNAVAEKTDLIPYVAPYKGPTLSPLLASLMVTSASVLIGSAAAYASSFIDRNDALMGGLIVGTWTSAILHETCYQRITIDGRLYRVYDLVEHQGTQIQKALRALQSHAYQSLFDDYPNPCLPLAKLLDIKKTVLQQQKTLSFVKQKAQQYGVDRLIQTCAHYESTAATCQNLVDRQMHLFTPTIPHDTIPPTA